MLKSILFQICRLSQILVCLFLVTERDHHTKMILRKVVCMEKSHLFIHYVELDKMNNEKKC